MKFAAWVLTVCFLTSWAASSGLATADDWPQFRGQNRDGKATGFEAPGEWPEKLTKKWEVSVGDGVASPALVDGKLFIYTRQGGDEILRCLNAETGEEIWKQGLPARAVGGAAGGFPGPRSTPTVADGKVVILGVEGVLSCHDAETGAEQWRVSDYRNDVPRFATSSSPIIVEGLCIAQLGSERDGLLAAYDLKTGEEVWKLSGMGPSYGSPVQVTMGDIQGVVAPTESKMVVVGAADGKLLWEMNYSQGRYNAATPMIVGDTLVFAGPTRGLTALKLATNEEKVEVEDTWRNEESSVQFNTPVIRDGLMFGLSNLNSLFCVDTTTGETAWSAPVGQPAAAGDAQQPRRQPPQGEGDRPRGERPDADRPRGDRPDGDRPEAGRPGGGRPGFGRPGGGRPGPGGPGGFRGRGGRGGGGSGGYGTVVDAGSVIVALPASGQLIVFEPSAEEFKQLASYQVAEGATYGYPILTGNRIYVKDRDAITLWTVE